jgi:hypothetical protein
VTYDDINIPDFGAYTIGYSDPWRTDSIADEFQNWGLSWNGIGMGWMFDTGYHIYPRLYFTDGKLSGIESIYHADLWPGTRK